MATIKLEIVSPDKVVYTADINMLIVRSTAGELGILPKHAPMVTGLIPHAMRVKIDGTESLIAVAGGFMEVLPEKITVELEGMAQNIVSSYSYDGKADIRVENGKLYYRTTENMCVVAIHLK